MHTSPTVGASELGLAGNPPDGVRAFRDRLTRHAVNVTVRRARGVEINAACGQVVAATPLTLGARRERPRS